MKTKVTVWAFNEFVAFDTFTRKVIGKTVEAEAGYNGKDQVKMVNLTRDHGLALPAIQVLIQAFCDVDINKWAEFHNRLYRQDGTLRKGLKTVKLELTGICFIFDFN